MESSNRLIASLPESDRRRWAPHFERMNLPQGYELFGPDDALDYLWFPENGVCSLVLEIGDGRSVEIALAGREGMIGLPAVFGTRNAATRAIAQTNTTALRIKVEDFQAHIQGDRPLLQRLERYAAASFSCLSQIAACNRLHRTEQRLCRWLLMIRDRAESEELPVTHDFLALMIGTRRASVTEVAQRLQQRELIRYERGVLEFLDVPGLEACSCECYGIIRRLYAGYLSL